jgi:PAS domain S-box-containing protein
MTGLGSVRNRLAMLITAVVIAVVAVFGAVSIREVRNSALAAASERLGNVSRQLVDMLAQQARQLRGQLRTTASDEAVRAFLRSPDAKTREAVLTSIRRLPLATSPAISLELWDGSARRVLSTQATQPALPDREARELGALVGGAVDVAIGPLVAEGDSVHYAIIAKVSDGAAPLGFVVQRRLITGSAQAARQLRELVGTDAGLYVGNARGDVWTDFSRATPPPPIDVHRVNGVVEYVRPELGTLLASVSAIPETPWTLAVESSRAAVLAHAHGVEWRMTVFSALLVLVAAAGAWAVSGSLTRPLYEVASAADAISRGDYARRVNLVRQDEIGLLALAFNGMARSITAARDVLESQIARVAASEARLTHVIGASSAVIYELRFTPDGVMLEWISENVTRVLGYEVAEARAPSWWSSNVHPEDRERFDRRTAPESFKDGSTEYRFRTKDGRYLWLREEQRVLLDDHDQPAEVVGAWLDITDQRGLEEQFRQAQKMEAVGRIAGGVAHDFNNLLTVIRSYADLVLLEMPDTDPKREEMLEIRGAADRAAALARQLLAFSRKQVLLPRVFDLNDVVKAFDAMLSRTLPRDVHHNMRLAQALGVIKADTGQIDQVLMNLTLNAADAMPDGGELTIETGNVTLDADYAKRHAGVMPGEYVMLAVSDTGTGMDRATLDHIFEPFFTTKPSGKGTGLGLSTAYGIVKQNGGHIWVYSEPGHGTTFKVYFPRVYEQLSAPQSIPQGVRPPGSARPTETVLVVEDEPAVRATLARILQRQGYTVLPAAHGGDAMRIATEYKGAIDLVISDLMMPEMSGREFVERFAVARPETQVLFMSGYTDDDAQQRGLVEDQRPFIQKPFTVEQMARKVREVLDHA